MKLLKFLFAFLLMVSLSNAQAWKGFVANQSDADVTETEAEALDELSDAIDGISAAEAVNLMDYAQAPGTDAISLLTAAEAGYLDGASIANSTASKAVVLNAAGDIVGVNADTLSSVTGVSGVTIVSGMNISTITLASYPMVITDSAGSGGHGALKVVDFPNGMIYVLGVVADMSSSAIAGAGATSAVDMALGSATTLTNAETLGNANVDFVAKVDEDLSSSVGVWDILTNTPQTEDGHTANTEVWLCVAIEDSDMTATGTITLSGTIVITWVNTGDY